MPEVFKKNCKMTVIEYGAHAQDLSFKQIKDSVMAFICRLWKK